MSQGRSSGVRLIVRPGHSASLALPVPRQACSGLARAVLAAAAGVAGAAPGVSAPAWPWLSSSEAVLAEVLAGNAWRRLDDPVLSAGAADPGRAIAACHAAGGVAPPAALAGEESLVWLWVRLLPADGMGGAWDGLTAAAAGADGAMWSRIRPGAVRAGRMPLASLARDLVSGPLADGLIDVDESAWRAWVARGPAEADPSAQGAAWADRLRGGDLPVPQVSGGASLSVEGGELLATVRLAADHVHLARTFQDALGEARLEAMRELAYGAGHEINNPLANIATRAQTLLLDERDPERRRRLSTIVDQAFRARDLIGGLMLFARPPRPHRAAIGLHAMVSAVIDRLGSLAGQRIARLEYSPAPASLSVAVDRSQVEEAIRAVVSNALEAVGEGGLVTVSVSVGRATGDCDLLVVDDGPGIDPTTLRRVFDPFFSGREAGRGAGLGLSKAWRFLEANGGTIEIESRAGRGTRVLIRLPLAESEGATPAAVRSPAPEGRPPDASSLACASPLSTQGRVGKVAAEPPA